MQDRAVATSAHGTGPGDAAPGIAGRVRRRMLGWARAVSRAAKGMALGGVIGAGLLFTAYPDGSMPLSLSFVAVGMLAALFASPIVGAVGALLRLGGLRREGTLRRDARGLVLERPDGRVSVMAARLASGVVVPSRGRVEVLLQLEDGNELSVLVGDDASADALLDLAGVGPEQRRTRVTWGNAWRRLGAGAFGFLATLLAGATIFAMVPPQWDVLVMFLTMVAPFATAGGFSRWFAWRELEVGTDGIAWRYRGRRKSVPLSDVRRVEVLGDDLVLGLADGTDRRFSISRRGLAEGLRRRIEAVLAAVGRGEGRQSLFARGEITFSAWVERMQGMLRKGGTHRERPVDVGDALAVLEDPHAEVETRVGAAIALGRADASQAARVRVVAETCVSPKLRVALESAVHGEVEEEALEEARRELRLAHRGG
jgi:hypothetical protein